MSDADREPEDGSSSLACRTGSHIMKRLLLSITGLGFSALAMAAQPLLSPTELQGLLADKNVRVVDIRPGDAYATQHIPGALSAPYGTWRGPAANPGQLPGLPELQKRVQSLGLAPEHHVVVVSSGADQTDFGASARVYWTLKSMGFKELSVLNGGTEAWAAAKLPQDKAPVAAAASAYAPNFDAALRATRSEVAGLIGKPEATLLDVRVVPQYQGKAKHDAAKVAGTVKGAVNLPHTSFFLPDSKLMGGSEHVRKVLAGAPVDAAKGTVVFCNTGHWGATGWFALSEVAGMKNVRLYAESMVDWTQSDPLLPMDNVPSGK